MAADGDVEYKADDKALDEMAGKAVRHEEISERAAPPYAKVRTLKQVIRKTEEYPEINPSEKILLLIDECHRSHTLTMHANLMKALPNAAKIGFTGTPIMNRDRGNTLSIFHDFIDKYPLDEAVADEATVKILYEGRVPLGMVENASQLDALVSLRFAEFTEPEQQIIMRKFAYERKVLEAPKLIGVKARDIMRHYVRTILPGGLKAHVVAVSQAAAVEYRKALAAARDDLVRDAEQIDPCLLQLTEEDLLQRSEEERSVVWAHRVLDRLKALEFAAVISGQHNQSADWERWSDPSAIETNISNFKKPFEHKDPDKRSNLAMLCVMRMLLTGFDAPVEQALYLDRRMKEHELLQAIARVNRKRSGKDCGYVIDYIGIARELKDALVESEEGASGAQRPDTGIDRVLDEIPLLRDRHQKVLDVFRSRGIQEIMPIEPCVELLEDEKVRAEFLNRVRAFFTSLAIVMPRPEALPFVRDAKILGFIAKVAANLYRDNQLNLEGVDKRMKSVIDEYVSAQGIDPRIPPIEITDLGFGDYVKRKESARARASEMKHALRHYIRLRFDEDPSHYKKLSERLEEILRQLKDHWADLERALQQFIQQELEREKKETIPGLDARMHAPFFGTIKEAIEKERNAEITPDDPSFREVADLTVSLVDGIRAKIQVVDFWKDSQSRLALEKSIYRKLGRKEEELHRLPAKEYVSGEGFYYLGRKYRLKLLDDPATSKDGTGLRLQNGRFLMTRELAPKGQGVFVRWYTEQAMEHVSLRVKALKARVAAEPEAISIRDLGFRWGSCTHKGKVFFHWRIILLPQPRIDYLITHELVHLHEHNHSPAFYERLASAAPDYAKHEDWLRRYGDLYSI